MNILFYTPYRVSPTKGGTERATITIARGLKRHYGCHCYSLYSEAVTATKEDCFDEERQWTFNGNRQEVCDFVNMYHIDWIINQGQFGLVEAFKDISKKTNCKLAFVHHYEPGWEENLFRWDWSMESLKKSRSIKTFVRNAIDVVLFPLMSKRHKYLLKAQYRNAYELSDQIVLLSKRFVSQYVDYAHLKGKNKFRVIPNGLSYEGYLSLERIPLKKKIVLIVSRLDERQKRLSLAIKIWNEVKKNPMYGEWILKIIGHGDDEKMYSHMIKQLAISDVFILGRQDPEISYEEASIFLMTSRSEGWGLTLTEAQQFGVVPIAFDSYASLTDIITNGEDGFIIPECDIKLFVMQLQRLMSDKGLRKQMAERAIINSKRFSQEEISNRWWKMLSNEK